MKPNTKILMIAATPFFSDRGCHIRIYSEAKYLKKEGFAMTLCTYGFGDDAPGVEAVRSHKFPWYKKTTSGASWHKVYFNFITSLGSSVLELFSAFRVATAWRWQQKLKGLAI